jgi:nitroreductase
LAIKPYTLEQHIQHYERHADDLSSKSINEIFKTICSRRSIRDYKEDSVSDEILREIIKAGSYAPSAANRQPWRFVVIKDKRLMKELSDKAKELWIDQSKNSSNPEIIKLANMLSRPNYNIFL